MAADCLQSLDSADKLADGTQMLREHDVISILLLSFIHESSIRKSCIMTLMQIAIFNAKSRDEAARIILQDSILGNMFEKHELVKKFINKQ